MTSPLEVQTETCSVRIQGGEPVKLTPTQAFETAGALAKAAMYAEMMAGAERAEADERAPRQ